MYGSNRSGLGADACPRPPFSLPDLSSQANYHQDRRRKSMSHTIQDRTATRFLARNFLPNSGVISRHARGNKGRWIALPLLFLGAGLMLVQPCASAPFEFQVTGSLATGRTSHTATLLPSGKVLIAAGENFINDVGALKSSELYDVGLDFESTWQPEIASAHLSSGRRFRLQLTGSLFQGVSQASGGNTQDSSTNYPIVQLRSIDNSQVAVFPVDPLNGWSDTSFVSASVINLPLGPALVTVFTNGIPSASRYLVVTQRQQ